MAKTDDKPIKRFFDLIRPEGPEIRLIFLFSVVTGAFSLALPLAVNSFVNTLGFGIQTVPFMQMLAVLLVVLLAALGFSGVLRVAQHFIVEIIQRRLFVRLASDLANRLPRVNPVAYGKHDGPELVNRFFEITLVQKTTSVLFLQGLNLLLSATVGVIVLSFYHPFLLAFVIVTALVLAGIIFLGGRRGIPTAIEESDAKYGVIAWVEQLANFPRLFKFDAAKRYAVSRTDKAVGRYLDARRSHFRILVRQIGMLISVEILASVALLGIGGSLVLSQQLTLGQLVAAELILATILSSIAKLGKQFEAWYDTMAAMNKLGYLIDLKPEPDEGDQDPLNLEADFAIEAKALTYRFDDGIELFDPVSLGVPCGAKHAIRALDGTGQSTLFELISGMRPPESGLVQLGGRRLATWHPQRLHKELMLVRDVQIFEGTVRENLCLGNEDISGHDIELALRKTGLTHFLNSHPLGLQTPLMNQGKNLSSGERIRLLVARALLQKPQILLIDDTLEKLSPGDRLELAQVLCEQDWTLLIGTQDPAVHQLCSGLTEIKAPALLSA